MSRTDAHFRSPPRHYVTSLAEAVQSNLITEEESNFIEIFISEVNALRQITEHRKYRIALSLISFRKYLPPYQTCTLSEIFVAIERYRAQSFHKAATQRTLLIIVKRFLLWLCDSEYTPSLDAKKLKKVTIKPVGTYKTAEDILANHEVQNVINATKNIRDRTLLELLYDSMGRIQEVATLRWGDITFHENYATVTLQSKTETPRKVPIYTAHVSLRQLKNYTSHTEPSNYIFAARDSNGEKCIAYAGVRQMVQKAAERAGITKNVTPHLFRHTRITDLMRMGISEQSIKMMAWGTVSTDMLKVYAHLTPSDVENEMNQMYGISTSSKLQAVPDIATPVQCKKCGLINPKSHQFCGGCTAALTSDVQTKHEEILEALEQGEVYEEILQLLRSKVGR